MAKLNPNAQKWVEALRSGKYKQVKERLKWGARRCCLGVACEVAAESLGINWTGTCFDGSDLTLPTSVQRWIGVSSDNPEAAGRTLAALNDNGKDFDYIARFIEEHAEELGISA